MIFLGTRANQKFFRAKLGLVTHENGPMIFLGTRANQKFFRAKLGLVTHENGPMGFFRSRAILEVLRQKLNSRLSVLKRGEHDYEGKKEEKR